MLSTRPFALRVALRGRDPFDELNHDAIRVGDLKQAFAPGFFHQRKRDFNLFGVQPLLLGFESACGEGQNQSRRALVAITCGQNFAALTRKIIFKPASARDSEA